MITRNVLSEIGGNASIIKTNNKYQAIATTTDCNIVIVKLIPFWGQFKLFQKAIRNLISVGAQPLAITNCLNFGNPEKK